MDEEIARLDRAAASLDEVLMYCDRLAEHLESDTEKTTLKAQVDELYSHVEALKERERHHDELPSEGDPERAGVLALLAEAKAIVAPSGADSLRTSMIERITAVRDELIAAREQVSADGDAQALGRCAASCDRLLDFLTAQSADAG